MNAQEIFDTVAKHLAAQGHRALKPDGDCAYRGVGSDKCAVGCLILDEEYDERMDSTALDCDVNTIAELDLLPERLGWHLDLLVALQTAHDTDGTADALRWRLAEIARKHRLSPAILDTLHFPEVWS